MVQWDSGKTQKRLDAEGAAGGYRMEQKRNAELDVAKGIAIVLMVLGHMHFSKVLDHYIYAFHMPIFFFISGMLFKPRPVKDTLMRKARALLTPYFVFGGMYWIIYNSKRYILHHKTDTMLPGLKALLLFPTTNLAVESALWFLPVMFLTAAGYCCLYHWIKKDAVLSVTVLALGIVGFALPKITQYRLPWGMDTAMVALLFYHIGREVGDHALIDRLYALEAKRRWLFYPALIAILAVNAWLIFVNDKVNMRLVRWAFEPLTLLNALTAIIAYIVVSKCLTDHTATGGSIPVKWLERISMTSVVYLCTNHTMIKYARSIATKAVGDMPTLIIVLTFAISMALMYGLGELIYRTKLKVIVGRR